MKRNVLHIKAPEKECTDKNCPFHGQLAVKKELFKGKVVKKDMNRSATVEWSRSHPVPKYERYEVRRSRMRVHNPQCLDVAVGQSVLVARTRPLSKTKNHVIIQVLELSESGKGDAPAVTKETALKMDIKGNQQPKETINDNETDKE